MQFKRYESRFEAGEILAELIREKDFDLYNSTKEKPNNFFCIAVPNGGVPVCEGFCSCLNVNYDVLIVRKIKIPWNTEAGFGSMTTDGTVLINEPLYQQLHLTKKQLKDSIAITKKEIEERLRFYNKEFDLEQTYYQLIAGKKIFIIDDGLASGFTMLAAIKMVKKYQPTKIFVAVPTAPLHTVERIEPEIEHVYCPNIRNAWRFAVADAYKHWYDVPESEVIAIITKSKYYIKRND